MQSSVTRNTDLVIALDNPSPSKLAKAEKLGIPIITIEQIRAEYVAATMVDTSPR
jgi:NAD-dependent DNA ligase